MSLKSSFLKSISALASVSRYGAVYLYGPSVNAAAKVVDRAEAFTGQKDSCMHTSDAVVTNNDERFIRNLIQSSGQFGQWYEHAARQCCHIVFYLRAHIENDISGIRCQVVRRFTWRQLTKIPHGNRPGSLAPAGFTK